MDSLAASGIDRVWVWDAVNTRLMLYSKIEGDALLQSMGFDAIETIQPGQANWIHTLQETDFEQANNE